MPPAGFEQVVGHLSDDVRKLEPVDEGLRDQVVGPYAADGALGVVELGPAGQQEDAGEEEEGEAKPAKKAPAKKAPAKKAPAKKAAVRRAPAKKAPAKKAQPNPKGRP